MAEAKKYKILKDGKIIESDIPGKYAGIKTQMIFGRLDCSSGKRAKKENRVFFHSWDDAIIQGYRSCKVCKPEKGAEVENTGGSKSVSASRGRNKKLAEKNRKPVLRKRRFNKPEVLVADKEAFEKAGERVGNISRIGYKDQGYRAGAIKWLFTGLAQEGNHSNDLNGGLVEKNYINEEIKRMMKGRGAKYKELIIEFVLNEAARELASVIPMIKKPDSDEFIRLYIIPSPAYDGRYGESIARRLQSLRIEDIRLGKSGGDIIPIKNTEGKIDKRIWAINPKKRRLPSKYHSTAAEKEIEDKKAQTTQSSPNLWTVGCFASAIHKPEGEREEPYITIPASHRLEAVTVAENQEGLAIVEYTPKGERLVRFWSIKDIIANERKFITGIKEGASDTAKKIVDVIKEFGSMTPGLISDHLGIERNVVEKELNYLEEPKMLSRKTWPGLYYDEYSQRYDFHLDWIQEKLVYPYYKDGWQEDSMLFFGCLHAGYNTTDYEHFINKYPEIILERKVKILAGLGDFIAGLKHDYMHTGEVFGELNYTDQEEFAAELIGSVIYKVFAARFETLLKTLDQSKELSKDAVYNLLEQSVMTFVYIKGNHDLWQEKDGHTSLVIFRYKLIEFLESVIRNFLEARNLSHNGLNRIINKKIAQIEEFSPIYTLPSGLDLSMSHPHMARAETTSLRAQKALAFSGCNIDGIANFHTSIVVHKWIPKRGQCVAVQAGTQVLGTNFEMRKLKRIDFGPVYLRVLSRENRIFMTESAFYNEPILKTPISKWTNVDELKKFLGISDILNINKKA